MQTQESQGPKRYDKRKFVGERGHTVSRKSTRPLDSTRSPDSTRSYTFEEALEIFVRAKEAENLRERTIRDYYNHMRFLTEYLRKYHPECTTINSLTSDIIRDYINYLRKEHVQFEGIEGRKTGKRGLSPTTINIRLRTLRTMCNFWYEEGMIETNPMRTIKPIRTDEDDLVSGYTDEEIEMLLKAPDQRQFAGWRDYVLMMLMLDTGMRPNEAVSLRYEQIDFRKQTIFVPSERAKNRKGREVPVSREVLKLLRELYEETNSYFDSEGYVFMSAYGEPLAVDTFRRRLWKYAKKCGIKKATPNMFRHTFCRNYILNGGDIFTLQRIVDHADIKTTRRYVQMETEHVQSQHNKYSPVRKFLKRK